LLFELVVFVYEAAAGFARHCAGRVGEWGAAFGEGFEGFLFGDHFEGEIYIVVLVECWFLCLVKELC
jgi:hypothetical protein